MEHIPGYDRWKTSPTDDCLGSSYSCGCTVYAGIAGSKITLEKFGAMIASEITDSVRLCRKKEEK